jgi:hypothetical protein
MTTAPRSHSRVGTSGQRPRLARQRQRGTQLRERDIQRIAERVVELLGEREHLEASAPVGSICADRQAPKPSGLVDAATLGQVLGVDRNWVYAHAQQLGGIRLGGPQGRLRFDLARIADTLDPPLSDAGRGGKARSRAPRRRSSANARRACTPADEPSTIQAQISMAGRRANAPGPTPGGQIPMHAQSTSRRAH